MPAAPPMAPDSSKIVLLLRLLAAIDEGRFSFDGLKSRVSSERPPSTRTLRRYLATLSDAGFPWYFDRRTGTYKFEGGYTLRRLELSGNELLGLLTLRGIATSLGGQIGSSIGDVTQKIVGVADRTATAAAERPAVLVHMADAHLDQERAATFELLQRAQRDRQSVRFGYVDKGGNRSQRHVDPYGFVVSSGRVYLIAHDRGRGAKRVFALDAIAAPRSASQRFVMPADFDMEAFAASSVSGIMHAEGVTHVTVRFSPVVAGAARAERVVRDRIVTECADGSLEIVYAVSDPHEFVRWALKWGAEAEIVAPPDVRAEVAAIARAIELRHSGPPT